MTKPLVILRSDSDQGPEGVLKMQADLQASIGDAATLLVIPSHVTAYRLDAGHAMPPPYRPVVYLDGPLAQAVALKQEPAVTRASFGNLIRRMFGMSPTKEVSHG